MHQFYLYDLKIGFNILYAMFLLSLPRFADMHFAKNTCWNKLNVSKDVLFYIDKEIFDTETLLMQ